MGGSLTRGYCELGPGPVELGLFLREAQSLPVPRSHGLHRLELAEQHRRVAPPGDEQGDWAPESLGGRSFSEVSSPDAHRSLPADVNSPDDD